MANHVSQYNKRNKDYSNRKKGKRHYPSKNRENKNKGGQMFGDFFNGNLANNMKFGTPDSELSGYVKREVYMKDQYGNVQRASEKQFFNSGKKLGSVRVDDERSKSHF
jgi:hypothetical protein